MDLIFPGEFTGAGTREHDSAYSPLRFIAAARLRGRVKRRARTCWLSAFDVSCCSPFDDSTPPAPQGGNRTTADDNRRSKLVRLLECGRRQKAQHTTHNVGIIVVTVARVLDRVLAASMRAPLKEAKLANERNRRPRARPKKVGRIFGPRRWISAVPDWR